MSEENDGEATAGGARGAIAAIIVLVILVAGGLWLARAMNSNAQIQDCVAAGRNNCAPIAGGK